MAAIPPTVPAARNVTPRRALRLAQFTRGLCLMLEGTDDWPRCSYWLRLADGAEAWAKASMAGAATRVWDPKAQGFRLTDYEGRILAQLWWQFFQFIA